MSPGGWDGEAPIVTSIVSNAVAKEPDVHGFSASTRRTQTRKFRVINEEYDDDGNARREINEDGTLRIRSVQSRLSHISKSLPFTLKNS